MIHKEDGFYVNDDEEFGQGIGIESEHLDRCIDTINRRAVRSVFGTPEFGFNETNLDFLQRMAHVEKVWFWDVKLTDVEGLYALSNLQYFGAHPKRPAIDFSRFPKLSGAVIQPKARDLGLGSLDALKTLSICHYRPSNRSFEKLAIPSCVTELQLTWVNVETLDSLPELPKLTHLVIGRCRNLEKLGDLSLKFPMLKHLVVTACGRIKEREALSAVQNLKEIDHAWIQKWHVVESDL